MILEILAIIPVMIIAQYFHEFGHFLIHFISGYTPHFGYNKIGIPDRVVAYASVTNQFTEIKLNEAAFAGIIAGFIPLFVYWLLIKVSMPPYLFIVVFSATISLYLYFCRSDLKSFIKKEIIINEGT